MNKLENLKGFDLLNDQSVVAIVGGLVANKSSKNSDVDSESNDSYSGDKQVAAGTIGN